MKHLDPSRTLKKIGLWCTPLLISANAYCQYLPQSSAVQTEVTCSSVLAENSEGLFGESSISDLDNLSNVIGKIRTEKAKIEKERILAELKAAQSAKDLPKQVASYEALVRLEPGVREHLVGLATAKTDGAVAYLVGVEKLLSLKEGYDRSLVRSLLNQADDLIFSANQDLSASIKGLPTGPQIELPKAVSQLNTRHTRIKNYMSQIRQYLEYSYTISYQAAR